MNRVVRKRKKGLKPIWKLFFLVFIITIILLIIKTAEKKESDIVAKVSSNSIIAENNVYEEPSILGQVLVDNQDGYTTIFNSLHSEYDKKYKEYKQNTDSSWSQNSYWGGTMSENGCGITSIAIIASGYNLEITPEDLREEYYPHLESEDMAYAIQDLGIECTDFYFHDTYISKKYITDWLKTGRPVLICVDNSKENVWTTASHYMVLLDVNSNGEIYISNPNGKDKTEKASGWYKSNQIIPYIVKALFIESY